METARRTPYQLTFAILAVAVGSFALMQSMTVPVLPTIEAKFEVEQSTATWVLTAYLLSASVFTPIIGRLGDSVGKHRMLVFSMVFLSLGSLTAALAPTIEVMIAGRVLTGIGGGVLPIAFGIIRDEFPRQRVAGAAGFVSSLMAVGFGTGIVVAGPISDGLGFRWLFWIPFIVTSLAALAAWRFVPESPVRTPGRIPVLPAVLMAGWLVALLLGLSQAPQWGWGSPAVLGLVAVAVVLLVAWVWVEHHETVPLIDMRMMRLKGVWTANLVALLVGFSMYATFGFLPQFLQTPESTGYGFGATTAVSGYLILPNAVASFICGIAAAPLARRLGAKTVVVAGGVLGSLGMAGLVVMHDSAWQILLVNGVAGFGIGFVFSSLAPLILAAVPAHQSGVASGMNANIRTIGGAIGTAVMSTIVTSQTASTGLPTETGYLTGFGVLAAMMLVAALAGLLIPTVRRSADGPVGDADAASGSSQGDLVEAPRQGSDSGVRVPVTA
ncbi:MFS transporter [Aeromicrobium sp. Leaf350]|uniref:MFS transporter n=1 Tax=Aeromicrobium sp. Leaf350 TaxID=2876565 RepID=UPI001E4E3017|nr:MFS transporter [Aeromicrobium sp. Leaf350]